MGPTASAEAFTRLDAMLRRWHEVQPAPTVRAIAKRLVRVHPLRTADSLQLAAALFVCEKDGAGLEFACLDLRPSEAAAREGLRVTPPLAEFPARLNDALG
jgi:hypothetical protein